MPFGVVALSNHIEVHTALYHLVNKPDALGILATQRYMQHHHGFRCYIFYSGGACLQQPGQAVGVLHVAFGPHNAMVDLVAYLHHIGQGSLCFQRHHHIVCVHIKAFLQPHKANAAPCGRFVLFAGIGPIVAVMKIEQQPHAGSLHPFGHGQRVAEVTKSLTRAVATVKFGAVKNAQPHKVEAMVFQDGNGIFFHAIIAEADSAGLQLGQVADIGAQHFGYGARFGHITSQVVLALAVYVGCASRCYSYNFGAALPKAGGGGFKLYHAGFGGALHPYRAGAVLQCAFAAGIGGRQVGHAGVACAYAYYAPGAVQAQVYGQVGIGYRFTVPVKNLDVYFALVGAIGQHRGFVRGEHYIYCLLGLCSQPRQSHKGRHKQSLHETKMG